MIYLCYVLFGLVLLSYVLAAFNISSGAGETYSDFANAFMLLTAVLLLFRAERRSRKSEQGN